MRSIHLWKLRVYWEDTDAGGVVFYANYLSFFERARTEWLRQLGFSQRQLSTDYQAGFMVMQADIKYLAPAFLDDEISIYTKLVKVGKASLLLEQIAKRSSDLLVLSSCSIRLAWVNFTNHKPDKIPLQLWQRLNK